MCQTGAATYEDFQFDLTLKAMAAKDRDGDLRDVSIIFGLSSAIASPLSAISTAARLSHRAQATGWPGPFSTIVQ